MNGKRGNNAACPHLPWPPLETGHYLPPLPARPANVRDRPLIEYRPVLDLRYSPRHQVYLNHFSLAPIDAQETFSLCPAYYHHRAFLSSEYLLAHVSCCSELNSKAMFGFSDEPHLPGKTMEDSSVWSDGQPQYDTPESTERDAQLMSPGSDAFTEQCATSETPMCRICHDGGVQEELLSPCECSGSLATIHRSCLEHWLSASGTDFCELCHHRFTVQRKPKPLLQWLRTSRLRPEKRTLFGDMLCFLLITPVATFSGWLCLRGAIDHLQLSSRLEAVGLIALTAALFIIYLFWTLVSLRYHCRLYNKWRWTNQRVVVLLPRSHSDVSAALQSFQCKESTV